MPDSIEFMPLFSTLGSLVVIAISAAWKIGTLLLSRLERQLDEKFADMADKSRKQSAELTRIERELLELKAVLPEQYQRRDDAVRLQSEIMLRMDGMANLVQSILRDK